MRFERFGRGITKGMWVTLKNFLRSPVTTQYPEERLVLSRRIRSPQLLRIHENCTGCGVCAKACPIGNIEIISHPEEIEEGGKKKKIRVVDEFIIDLGRCAFCGLCVEACRFNALFMGRNYEQATYLRSELIKGKGALSPSSEEELSGYFKPELEAKLPQQSLLIYMEKGKRGGRRH